MSELPKVIWRYRIEKMQACWWWSHDSWDVYRYNPCEPDGLPLGYIGSFQRWQEACDYVAKIGRTERTWPV